MADEQVSDLTLERAQRDKVRELRGKWAKKMAQMYVETSWAKKDRQTDFGPKFKYASADSMYADIRAAAQRVGLALVPLLGEPKIDRQANSGKERTDTHVVQPISVMVIDTDTGFDMEIPGHGEASDTSDKGISKAITAALKYTLRTLFLIPTGDDPDAGSAAAEKKAQPAKPQTPEDELKATAAKIAENLGMKKADQTALLDACHARGLKSYREIVDAHAAGCTTIAGLMARVNAKPLTSSPPAQQFANKPNGVAPTSKQEASGAPAPESATLEMTTSERTKFGTHCRILGYKEAEMFDRAAAEGCTTFDEAMLFVSGLKDKVKA
jgi:hypothetical protein